MVEQIPLSLILHDAVVGGPTNDGLQNDTLIGEGAVGRLTDSVAQIVTVACGVAEVVLSVILVHP